MGHYPVSRELKELAHHDAAYNSFEHEHAEASVCASQTLEAVLEKLDRWARGQGNPVCWLYGPAGAGKSTIAHTVAQRYDKKKLLAFSYFFSRRYINHSNLDQFISTFAFELICHRSLLTRAVNKALKKDPRLFQQRLENQLVSIVDIINPLLSASHFPAHGCGH
ncbi:hypothetical protein C8J56DRAFT_826305 [Mycena floridula]|nr:hypothetical protein C8J56DRAFT_826305 [Mycena floridula]